MSDALLICPACGAETAADNVFCGICGVRMEDQPADSLIGKVIADKFRVRRLLGSGGMGAIYLAEHVDIGKRVAIKLLRADLRGHPHLVKRFRREARAVSKLTDAHTITVFDFGVWDGVVYLVMEYLIGDDLSKILAAERRLSPWRALHIAHQICSSLAEAHTVGVVHRDLKPENVFLTRTTSGDELVKVLDFGLAKILAPEGSEALLQTADGALMGTPYYMAPEQVRGEEIEPRTDLYALGGLLFRMLTGEVPYAGKSPLQVMEAHVGGALRRFAEVDPTLEVPPGVEALVRRLMARKPADRPESALAVDQEIVALLDGLAPERPDRVEGPRSRPAGSASPDAEAESGGSAPGAVRAPAPETAPGRPSALGASSAGLEVAEAADAPAPGALRFDDEPGDVLRPARAADRAATSWVIGDGTPAPPDAPPVDRRSARGRGGWVVLLLVVFAAGAGAAGYAWYVAQQAPPTAEVEPNETPRQASPIAEGEPLTGTIGASAEPGGDRDVFVVAVPPDRRVALARVSGVEGIDLMLEGFAYDGAQLFGSNARGAGRGEFGQAEVPTDRLLLVVRPVVEPGAAAPSAAGTYRLWVRFDDRLRRRGPWGEGDEREGDERGEGDAGADAGRDE